MRASITLLATALALIAACTDALPRPPTPVELPRVDEAPAAAAPTPPAPTPPATTRRIARGRGPERLSDFGLPVVIRVPAGAELAWSDGSPDVDPRIATVRVTHDRDPDDGVLHDSGLRLFVRAPVDGELTELPAFEEHLRAEPARIDAELADLEREYAQAEKELREVGIELPDEDDDDFVDPLTRLEIVHRRTTRNGWELMWTLEEGGMFTVKVWRPDLGLFCVDVIATRPAALRTLDVCRTLAPG